MASHQRWVPFSLTLNSDWRFDPCQPAPALEELPDNVSIGIERHWKWLSTHSWSQLVFVNSKVGCKRPSTPALQETPSPLDPEALVPAAPRWTTLEPRGRSLCGWFPGAVCPRVDADWEGRGKQYNYWPVETSRFNQKDLSCYCNYWL